MSRTAPVTKCCVCVVKRSCKEIPILALANGVEHFHLRTPSLSKIRSRDDTSSGVKTLSPSKIFDHRMFALGVFDSAY